jgi:hypothetical protein
MKELAKLKKIPEKPTKRETLPAIKPALNKRSPWQPVK